MFRCESVLLGVNIDHIATIRQARKACYPDPVKAALDAEESGADGITLHLREDRRHIQEKDVELLRALLQTRMNLELAVTDEMIAFAIKIKPDSVCFVPEKREELTTEGGLDLFKAPKKIQEACDCLQKQGIMVSLFIEPNKDHIDAAIECGAKMIELHTGAYSEAKHDEQKKEWHRIQQAVHYACEKNMIVNAGHGLHYHNVSPIAAIPGIYELNIGHAIISRAMFIGLRAAVVEMKNILRCTPRTV